MELAQKGASANTGSIENAKVVLSWTTAADFDLAALWEKKDGSEGLVYFGNKGNLNAFPFMQLDKDAAVGDKAGDNEEKMIIAKIDPDVSKIHIVCWDYGAVENGSAARFKDSDVKLTVQTGPNDKHNVVLDSGDLGNVCVVATIDNTNEITGAALINTSKVGTLKGLNNSKQILEIVNNQ